MSDDPLDVDHFKQKLLHLHDSLTQVEQSGNEAAQTVESDQSTVGRLSRMDVLQGQAMAKASHQRRMIQQQRIGSALQRIERQLWCVCTMIHLKRLEVDPTTLVCIEWAKNQER